MSAATQAELDMDLVVGLMFAEPLMTRETVWCDTPASLATSAITGLRRAGSELTATSWQVRVVRGRTSTTAHL